MYRTPFYQFHVEHGAKFVDFFGWEMPILYSSIHEEHHQVRTAGGLFDVSHMGRLKISGRDARGFLERVLTRQISDMKEQSCRYSLICNEQGGTIDDVIVYRFEDHWLLVVNAGNRSKVVAHLQGNVGGRRVKIDDQTEATAMVALQGPGVIEQIGRFSQEVPSLKRYRFCTKNLLVVKLVISRTGYSGEDGVEVIMPAGMAGIAVKMLVKSASGGGDGQAVAKPAGLGARDTLRIEAGMPLYGHELDETLDPISAGLGFAVSLDKELGSGNEDGEGFIGQEALKGIKAQGLARRLVGLKLEGKRTARQGMSVYRGDQEVGGITSGCVSPTLGYPIAMAYVDGSCVGEGEAVSVGIGSRRAEAEVVKLPFYKNV